MRIIPGRRTRVHLIIALFLVASKTLLVPSRLLRHPLSRQVLMAGLTAKELSDRGVSSVTLIMFLDAIAASLGVSVLPYFVSELGGSPATFGTVLSTFAASNIVASLWIGAASDTFGRKPLLLFSLLGMCVGFFLTGTTQTIHLLFVARATVGFFAGVGSTGRAYVADICTKEERGPAMARLGGVMMFGYAGGPPVGAAIGWAAAQLGFDELRAPFFCGAAASMVALAVTSTRMPTVETIKAARLEDSAAADAADPAAASKPADGGGEAGAPGGCATATVVGLLLLQNVLVQASTSCFLVLQPLLIREAFGWGSAQAGHARRSRGSCTTRDMDLDLDLTWSMGHGHGAWGMRHGAWAWGMGHGAWVMGIAAVIATSAVASQFAIMMTAFILMMAVVQVSLFGPAQKKVKAPPLAAA